MPNVMEIWEPKPSGILWATLYLLRDSFTFYFTFYLLKLLQMSKMTLRVLVDSLVIFVETSDNSIVVFSTSLRDYEVTAFTHKLCFEYSCD
jgi:hypothetical protein